MLPDLTRIASTLGPIGTRVVVKGSEMDLVVAGTGNLGGADSSTQSAWPVGIGGSMCSIGSKGPGEFCSATLLPNLGWFD